MSTDDDFERSYAGILDDIATLALQLAKKEPYKSSHGPDALLEFADHLKGIVAGVGVVQSGPVPKKKPRKV